MDPLLPMMPSSTVREDLPSYSAENSNTPPSYTLHPSTGEHSLLYTHSTRMFALPSGVFTTASKTLSVTIVNQEEGAQVPSFDRSSLVVGSVDVQDCVAVTGVKLKLKGKLRTAIHGPGAGSKTQTLVDDTFTLWERGADSCPSSLPFSFEFPASFTYDGRSEPLPPSHRFEFHDARGGIVSKAKFSLTVIVSRNRFLRARIKESLRMPLKYCPRSRPRYPIIPLPRLFASIKTCPEEWHQSLKSVQPKPNSSLESIQCIFFAPSVRTFGLSDKIPFHVQMSGNRHSLQELHSHCVVRVDLIRRVFMKVKGTSTWACNSIGEGYIRPIPLPWDRVDDPPDGEVTMDWDGEIYARQDEAATGSFSAANMKVKDFIVLTVESSSNYRPSPFLPFRCALPVRLVTDTWGDSFASDDQLGLI